MSVIEYRYVEGMPDEDVLRAVAALARILNGLPETGQPDVSAYAENCRLGLSGRPWIHLGLAYADEELVGYKLGRSDDPRTFESWRGGVLERFRRRGIARTLAQRQEAWCRQEQFRFMTTLTDYDNRPMLILNLQQGYAIAGTFTKRGQVVNVALEKALSGH